jgi:hypothetical protein
MRFVRSRPVRPAALSRPVFHWVFAEQAKMIVLVNPLRLVGGLIRIISSGHRNLDARFLEFLQGPNPAVLTD